MFWRKATTTKWLHVNIQLLQSRITISFWHQETDKGEKENFEKNSNQRFILFPDSISGSQSVSLESDQVQERTPSENSQGCPLVHYLSPILILSSLLKPYPNISHPSRHKWKVWRLLGKTTGKTRWSLPIVVYKVKMKMRCNRIAVVFLCPICQLQKIMIIFIFY